MLIKRRKTWKKTLNCYVIHFFEEGKENSLFFVFFFFNGEPICYFLFNLGFGTSISSAFCLLKNYRTKIILKNGICLNKTSFDLFLCCSTCLSPVSMGQSIRSFNIPTQAFELLKKGLSQFQALGAKAAFKCHTQVQI